jgi:hypothetical protein
LPLGRRKLKRRWGILHWQGRRLSLAEETFAGLCESLCEGSVRSALSSITITKKRKRRRGAAFDA